MNDFPVSDRTRVRRLPERGAYDAESVHQIIDAVMVSHVGFTIDERPFVIPMLHARDGERLLLHGASSSRLLRHIAAGNPLCVCITAIDGLVLAKTAFNQSVNYRSVVIFGQGMLIDDAEEKLRALATLTNRLVPGQWDHVRHPNAQELKATSIVAVPITEASAKVRSGPPRDDEEDQGFPAWAGVVPIVQVMGAPRPAPYTDASLAVPLHIQDLAGTAPLDDHLLNALLDGWERNNVVLHNLLRALPAGGLMARATPTSPTVGQMFTHLCHERLVSVEENAPEHAGARPPEEWGVPGDIEALHALLDHSAERVRAAVVARAEDGRSFDRSFAHPAQLIQFLIFHEAYHHGQVKLALKVAGTPLADDLTGPITWDAWRRR